MNSEDYLFLKKVISEAGYREEIDWCESLEPVSDPDTFFSEYAWVVVNSGMKNQIARKIWQKVSKALSKGLPVSSAFGHPGKAAAIQYVWDNKERLFGEYLEAKNKLLFIESLPWIGKITKYHLAKNYGFDVAKPDRHLVRLAEKYGKKVDDLCRDLALITGDRIATVDLVLWRAANLGVIATREMR